MVSVVQAFKFAGFLLGAGFGAGVPVTGGGLALMVLPSLIVGNELLILAGVAAAVGLWFLAHRHGQLRGLVNAATPNVEDPANKV